MRRWPTACGAALFVALIPVSLPGVAQSRASFALGVLRHDGVLVPFAVFDGDAFERRWPEPGPRAEVPLTLDAVPSSWWPEERPEREWRLQPLEGAARSVEITGPTWVPVQCQHQVALLTDYRPEAPPPPPEVQPYPKEGLAWTGNATVEPIEILTRESAIWQRLEGELTSVMQQREQDAIEAEERFRFRHPASEETRQRTSASLEAVYGAPASDAERGRLYYVEAAKRYKRPRGDGDADCDLVTFISGWVRIDNDGEVTPLHLQAHITACDYHSVALMHPLALLRMADGPRWIVQWSTWGQEEYEILGHTSDKIEVEFETTAGVCPR